MGKIITIQRWMRKQLKQRDGLIKLRKMLYPVAVGWAVRRSVNCIGKEIQQYVNCEDGYVKQRLKRHI